MSDASDLYDDLRTRHVPRLLAATLAALVFLAGLQPVRVADDVYRARRR